MTKLEFERLLNPLIDIIGDIETDIMHNIINRIDNYDGVKGTLDCLTDKLVEFKVLDKENKKTFKKSKKILKETIEKIAKTCGHKIDNYEKLKGYYKSGLLETNPDILSDSVPLQNIIKNAIKDTDDIMNLIQTKAIEGASESYKKVLNKAYIETASGTYTYTESIRRALNEFAQEGITVVHYKNGKKLSIESVTRRDVLTRMNKLVGDVELQHAKDLGTNLVYVDQHLGARTRTPYMKNDYEAHCEWQGKKYMIEGSSEKYDNLYEKTGYGEMLGLKGINCYHNLRPTWEWEKVPKQLNQQENAKEYEKLQTMRAYERRIRRLKRERIVAKETDDKDKLKSINKKMSTTNQKYNQWLEENNLTRDYSREYVSDGK